MDTRRIFLKSITAALSLPALVKAAVTKRRAPLTTGVGVNPSPVPNFPFTLDRARQGKTVSFSVQGWVPKIGQKVMVAKQGMGAEHFIIEDVRTEFATGVTEVTARDEASVLLEYTQPIEFPL